MIKAEFGHSNKYTGSPGRLFMLRGPKGLTPWVNLRCQKWIAGRYGVGLSPQNHKNKGSKIGFYLGKKGQG